MNIAITFFMIGEFQFSVLLSNSMIIQHFILMESSRFLSFFEIFSISRQKCSWIRR